MLKPNAFGLPHTEAKQPPPIALSEAQIAARMTLLREAARRRTAPPSEERAYAEPVADQEVS